MRKTRKCAFCGKEFTCNSGSQRYCSEHCAEAAKAQRKKRQQDFLKAVQPVIDIASQEYLTFSKAAILMGCSRQYVYKLVNEGKLPASRISNRMAFVRKADIEKMLAGNPYHRVLPGASSNTPSKKSSHSSSSSLLSKKGKNQIGESPMRFAEPLDYISGEDVMAIYKVKKSWLYVSAKRNNIPMCKIAGKNYYSRKHMDALFGVSAEIEALTEWLTTDGQRHSIPHPRNPCAPKHTAAIFPPSENMGRPITQRNILMTSSVPTLRRVMPITLQPKLPGSTA